MPSGNDIPASRRPPPHDAPCFASAGDEAGDCAQCQLYDLPGAGARFGRLESAARRLRKSAAHLAQVARRSVADPGFVRARVRRLLRRDDAPAAIGGPAPRRAAAVRLGLAPGERVRVKSAAEIRATLDDTGRCEGLGYMPDVMDAFCGRTFVVRKRVHQFFDERRWRLLKLRNVVILDGVFCEPPPNDQTDYAGCDRTCFLFWKEAWLERANADG